MSTVSRCLANRGCNTFLWRPGYLPKSVCWIFLFLKPMAAARTKKSTLLFFQTFKRWIIDCMTFQFKELAWVTDCCLIVLTYLKQTNFEQHPLQNFGFKRSNHQSFLPKYFSVNFSNMARCLFLTKINSLLLNFHHNYEYFRVCIVVAHSFVLFVYLFVWCHNGSMISICLVQNLLLVLIFSTLLATTWGQRKALRSCSLEFSKTRIIVTNVKYRHV